MSRLIRHARPLLPRWILAGSLLLGCGVFAGDDPGETLPPLLVSRQAPIERHLLTGELVAQRSVEITVPDVGIRPLEIRWMVENGARVEDGASLFELDNTDLASRLDASRVSVLEARSKIATIESQSSSKVADAAFELERRKADLAKARIDAAVPAELRSAEEYQRLRVELQKAERRVADAERGLAVARDTTGAEIEKQRLQLGREEAVLRQVEGGIARLAIVAPIAGVVLISRGWDIDRPFEPGDIVFPGHRLAELPDLTSLVARARLFDVDDGRVVPGMLAKVELDAHPGIEYPGVVRTVDRIAFEREYDSTSRVFWVTVDLASVDPERMRAGMSVKVTVDRLSLVGEGPGALVAPRASLDLTDLDAPRALLADGTWRAVRLGGCAPLQCVLAEGLEEGQALGRVGPSEGS